MPSVIGDPQSDVPVGKVPPDDTLRRLWLVRAQLVPHLNETTSGTRSRKLPHNVPSVIAALGVSAVFVAAMVAREDGDPWFLGTLFAALFLLVPTGWLAYCHASGLAG